MSMRLLSFTASLLIAIGAAAAQSAVEVTDAWARATPGKAENGAAYLTMTSAATDRLIALSTPVADKAELHLMTMEGGIMRMRPLAGVDLAPGQKVALTPGGAHIMLVRLKEPLRAGQSFPITLRFERAGAREVTVIVAKAGAMAPANHTGADIKTPMPAGR